MMDIKTLRTPTELLTQEDLPVPDPIYPWVFTSFEHLYQQRDKIRNLQLVPMKAPDDRANYNAKKSDLIEQLKIRIKDRPFHFGVNEYPYATSNDVCQYILWINEGVEEDAIDAELLTLIKLLPNPERVILFERSRVTNTKLARGTVKQIRHIHFWFELKF